MSHCPIIYINLESRKDRREHMEKQFIKYSLDDSNCVVERFDAISNPGFGIWGCGMSHLGVLKLARDRGYPYVWIMEDDFEFVISPEEFKTAYFRLVESEEFKSCDVFMGASDLHESETIVCENNSSSEYKRVLFAQTASCYIVKAHYYQKLIELYEEAMPKLAQTGWHWEYANDIVWRDLQKNDKWICPVSRWGKQMSGYSDNAQTYMSYDC